ncbi:hypothetical protein G7Y89_g11665 [Cudoniella acicularis]|uniref:Uncharacterized protein n=1 Tax=Cudoniella acicularis TaxID=354080 RepID=A0A8H4RCQ1_9HELO|nr:hypothetical protein G7Y89_g11665 [Cudoniella acicularis]
MSSSTALLPKDRKNQDHPVFLRVCHSPWAGIGQKSLVGLRFLIALYLLISFSLIIYFEIDRNEHGWLTIFEFSNITFFIQVIYHWIVFIWTFMHLHYPHHGNRSESTSTLVQRFFSPPRQSTNNRECFSIFYYAASSLPHVATLIHWIVLIPNKKTTIPADQIFGHGWFQVFFVFNKFCINSIIALVEIFFFSSIKRPETIWTHIFGITFLSLLYVAWAYLGDYFTGKFAYYFLDNTRVGWDNAAASIIAFVVSGDVLFVVVFALTGIREILTKNSENKSRGYTTLPQ